MSKLECLFGNHKFDGDRLKAPNRRTWFQLIICSVCGRYVRSPQGIYRIMSHDPLMIKNVTTGIIEEWTPDYGWWKHDSC